MRRSILLLALLTGIGAVAYAHPKGTIRLARKEVAVGGELVVSGAQLSKNETLRLQLRGTLETFPLAEVRTDASGTFQARLALPQEARVGNYTVVVLAPDGDVAAQAALLVIAAAARPVAGDSTAAEHPAGHAMPNTAPGATDMPHASAEMMQVQVPTSGAEWMAILAIIVASVAGGAALLIGALRRRA